MKLSIVTSFYNSEAYIEEQSNSILSQSYKNWEWIIADDFSSDSTRELLIKLSKKDSRIRLVELNHKKQLWWNPQLFSCGDVICPIDGDDKILPNAFEKIVYYFTKFPEAYLLHFNANKYRNVLPESQVDVFNNFVDNVYMSRDNKSFLEGFERLWYKRTGIFGYLRVFRNVPGLFFEEHSDAGACSSNDGQWLLRLEELGKSLTIPRTTYIAREHYDSENFRNWNLRGEVQLIKEAKSRRRSLNLSSPRKIDFFDDVYDAAESTYLSKLNWEKDKKTISFINFDYNNEQKGKLATLFFDHDVFFDNFNGDYCFVKMNCYDDPDLIANLADKTRASNQKIIFCDNSNLQNNNRTGINNLTILKEKLNCLYPFYFLDQENRTYLISL